MKSKCPYCGGELTGEAALPVMSGRTTRIYRALLAAGPDGIESTDLLVRMYGEEEWPTPGGGTVLRVQIHELNKVLTEYDQHIVWRGMVGRKHGRYKLTRREHDEKAHRQGHQDHRQNQG